MQTIYLNLSYPSHFHCMRGGLRRPPPPPTHTHTHSHILTHSYSHSHSSSHSSSHSCPHHHPRPAVRLTGQRHHEHGTQSRHPGAVVRDVPREKHTDCPGGKHLLLPPYMRNRNTCASVSLHLRLCISPLAPLYLSWSLWPGAFASLLSVAYQLPLPRRPSPAAPPLLSLPRCPPYRPPDPSPPPSHHRYTPDSTWRARVSFSAASSSEP